MTLRDCTLFVQVPRELICDESSSPNGKTSPRARDIRIVIADLDEKSEENRGEYWQSLEVELVSGGYYHGKGKLDNKADDCDLSESIWADQ